MVKKVGSEQWRLLTKNDPERAIVIITRAYCLQEKKGPAVIVFSGVNSDPACNNRGPSSPINRDESVTGG